MRTRFSAIVWSLALLSPTICDAEDASTQPAQKAALAWLVLTDGGQYALSWESAAEFFKTSVSKAAWVGAISSARSPLGALKSRQLKSAAFTRALPGAPAGEYVVIQFTTQFENKDSAIETITPMHEKDGSWKVSGYFIK
ncbi:MAG: DUF4019 domain-containing protein [Geothrix sp.]|nr:DUF4019 domain-containing protein [Geothrix sp.]